MFELNGKKHITGGSKWPNICNENQTWLNSTGHSGCVRLEGGTAGRRPLSSDWLGEQRCAGHSLP